MSVISENIKNTLYNKPTNNAAKLWIQGREKQAFSNGGLVYYKTPTGAVSILDKARSEGCEDCLSQWYENNIIHVTYNPQMANAPVKLVRNENRVSIFATLSFYGPLTSENFIYTDPNSQASSISTQTCANIALNGIKHTWRSQTFYADKNNYFGDYNSLDVRFDIRTVPNNSSTPHFRVNIKDIGQPICLYNLFWSAGKKSIRPVFDFVLCTTFRGMKFWKAKPRPVWEDAFKLQAAHEFGHVLGLGDAYGGLTQHEAPKTIEVPEGEIMRSNWREAVVYPNTIEMILEAFKTSSLQKYDPRGHSSVIRTY